MSAADRILISVAWPYASGPRHIGHVAGFGVPSDIFARYQRLRGASEDSLERAKAHGWTVVSMKADWATVFAGEPSTAQVPA